jgi:hypothetical protein
MKRRTGIVTKNCRLLCKTCGEVKSVKAIDAEILLVCGHSRPVCLPAAPGHISFENLRTKIGRELFPESPTHETPSDIDPPTETEPQDDDISVLPVVSADAVTVCLEAFEEFSECHSPQT